MLKQFKIKPMRLTMSMIVLVLLVLTITLIAFKPPSGTHEHLMLKVSEYAAGHGISVEGVKKDNSLMAQLQMEVNKEETFEQLTQEIQVTAEEIKNYRNMIGTSMDKKKATLILFSSEDECKGFIAAHGNDPNPHTKGSGTIPLMQEEDSSVYYNISGNEKLESIFDRLKDGEYTKEPFIYSDMYCYLKRLTIDSPIDNDDKLVQLIKTEKAQALLQNKE